MKVAVFANGHYGKKKRIESIFRQTVYDRVIGVDGGSDFLYHIGYRPDLIIGDLDSIDPETKAYFSQCRVDMHKYFTDKDETDTQLAVTLALEMGATAIDIYGGVGSRFDHSYGNLLLLNELLAKKVPAAIINAKQRIILIDTERQLHLPIGTTVSILSFSNVCEGVTLKGFQYALKDATLNLSNPGCGISNVTSESTQDISLKKGILLVVILYNNKLEVQMLRTV